MAGTQLANQGTRGERSLDLGFLDAFMGADSLNLDNLPGIDSEMIPVDTFFDSYVDTLGAAAAEGQQETGSNGPVPPKPGQSDGDLVPLVMPESLAQAFCLPQNGSAQSGAATQAFTTSPFSQPFHVGGSTSPTSSLAPHMNTNGTALNVPASQPAGAGMTMPSIPNAESSGGRGGRNTRHARGAALRATSNSSDDALHHLDHEKTKRNPKQQLQNKQAQQRYRERRKQRFQELEGALNALTDQMNEKQTEVSDLWNKNASLQGKTQELSTALQSKEAEVQALRNQVLSMQAQLTAAAANPTSSDGQSSGSGAVGEEVDAPRHGSGSLSASEVAKCREEYDGLIAIMRKIEKAHDLRHANPLGEGVDPDVLVRIRDLVSQGCKSSQSLDRKGGIHVLEVMGRRGDTHMGSHTCVEERARWGAVMEGMNLAPRQQEALLALRKQHLLRLTSIYQDRQHLNMQAMGLMLPGRGAGGGEGLSTKMACMSISSYMPSVANTLQLDTVLDQLKDNLREEQKAFMELKLVVLHRVLSPIQTLLFVVDAHPSRPDALALCNSVAFKLGRATEGCPKAAELLQVQAEAALRKSSAASSGQGAGSRAGSMEHASDDSSHRSDSCAAGI